MRRSSAVTAIVAAVVAGIVLGWNTIGQDRAFRTLVRDGDAALAAGDTSAAAAAFSGALAIRPNSTVARVKRGDAYRRRGELKAALADLTAAASLDPSATRAKEMLGDVRMELGQPAQAIEAYRAYLALDERAPLVLVKLAGAQLADSEESAALTSARRAIALDDRLAEAHYVEGLALRPRDPAKAARAFTRAIALKPALIPAREQLGEVLLASGRTKEAAEVLDAIAALDPANPGRAAAVVAAYSAAGKYDSALRRLEVAEEQFPEDPVLQGARGLILLDRAEAERDRPLRAEAEAALAPLAARERPSSAVLLGMGRARLLAGDAQGAVRWLLRATADLPVDAAALRLLARAAAEADDARTAMAALVRHEAIAPGTAWSLPHAKRIVEAALKTGDLAAAAKWLRRAERQSDGDAEVVALAEAVHRRAL
jgi:tetratricopeptide (TPR) repeat protein